MENSLIKIVIASAILSFTSFSYAASSYVQVGSVRVENDAGYDGLDKAFVQIAAMPGYSIDSNCGLFGLYQLKTKNLTDPLPKAQLSLLQSARIGAIPVTISYHYVAAGTCVIDGVML